MSSDNWTPPFVSTPGRGKDAAAACQRWKGMDGACAFHLIERHAENWNDASDLMEAWLEANGGSVKHGS
jgi:hypothetical protein